MTKAAVFDLDGVLLDSMGIWNDLGARYLRSLGVTPEEGLNEILFSMSMEQGAEYLHTHYALPQSAAEVGAGIADMLRDFYFYEVPAKDGAAALLAALTARGVKLAAATSSPREHVTRALERLGLLVYFTRLFTTAEVGVSKHEPTIYLLAAEALHAAPAETLVFEDSLYALKTAKAAGFYTIGVYDADGETVRHYTRYGNDYGNDYGPWDVMFLSYCLKYADIPQSAIPQVSSVLSLHSQLRSALYNEETGSGYAMDFDGDLPSDAAMPGDIVIYNGTVTKAVAAESQPLQVQDDSADADIALLSMDAAATTDTAPHIEEYTVDASTVGIVSDVDEDFGTLTVISGDVDGKVAKVTLNASQVTTLVSVANAQQADYGVATPDSKVEDDAGAITTIKGLDALDYLTALEVQRKNGTEYEDTNVTTISELLHSSLTVTDIPAKAIQENDYCVHVKLPKSFDVLNDELISGKLEDTGNYDTCGSYRLLKGNDGCWYAVLRYDQNYIKQKEEAAAGADTSDAKVTSNVAFNFQWNQSEVTSSGFNQIEVNKDYALDITINPDETPDEDQKDDKNYDLNQSVKDPRHDGSDAYLDYTVTLVVQNEQAGPLTLADSMTLPTGVTAEYVEDSLQLSMENGDTTLRITWENVNGERKITLGSAGSPIAAGTYSICYTVKLKDVGETAVDGKVINNIRILDTPISDDAEKSVKTDSLVITSQADPSDYELPSTGGAGTKLYTAGGGALMLAALVCGVCRKRRRERRAR